MFEVYVDVHDKPDVDLEWRERQKLKQKELDRLGKVLNDAKKALEDAKKAAKGGKVDPALEKRLSRESRV